MWRYVKSVRPSRSRPYSSAIGSLTLSRNSADAQTSSSGRDPRADGDIRRVGETRAIPGTCSTTTSWPRWTSSSAPAGVRATRYSRCLISLATPIRIAAARYRKHACSPIGTWRQRRQPRRVRSRASPTARRALARPVRTRPRRPRVLSRPLGLRRRRDHDVDPGIGEAPLQQRLRPGLDTEGTQRLERPGGRLAPQLGAPRSAEGPHHEDRDPSSSASGRILASHSRSNGFSGIWTVSNRPLSRACSSSSNCRHPSA